METNFPKAQRIEGIDGSSLYAEDILPFVVDKNWRDPYWNRRTTKGEVGCVLAHLKAWTLCIELNTSIIILEDDIIPSKDFFDFMRVMLNHYQSNNHIISISGCSLGYNLKTVEVTIPSE